MQKCTIEKLDNQSNKPIEKEVTNLPLCRCITKVSPMRRQKTRLGQWQKRFEKLENQKT
jgi:hypothetical protein